jgi:TnpA family transposase
MQNFCFYINMFLMFLIALGLMGIVTVYWCTKQLKECFQVEKWTGI